MKQENSLPKPLKLPWLKLLIPLIASVFIVVRIIWPGLQIDAITLVLLAIALLPWLSILIESAKLPGGYEITFRRIEDKQKQQQSEINTLQFLVSHFVSRYELEHLTKLAANEPFLYRRDNSFSFFEQELRRLVYLNLIERVPNGRGFSGLREQESGNVKDYFLITEQGREYLELRHQVDSVISDKNEDDLSH